MSGLERTNLLNKLKEEHELLQQSHYDGLTNLLNRSAFDTSLQRAFIEAATNTQFLSLLFIDIDHFKKFNDTYGHDIGDIVLKVVANCITTSLRTSDVAFRYGGEEMVVILPCTDAPNAIQVATRILQAVEVPFPEEFLTISGQHVTVSIGACTYPTTASSKESLLKNADTAMYASKEMGRNRCTHTLNIGATHSLYLKSA